MAPFLWVFLEEETGFECEGHNGEMFLCIFNVLSQPKWTLQMFALQLLVNLYKYFCTFSLVGLYFTQKI